MYRFVLWLVVAAGIRSVLLILQPSIDADVSHVHATLGEFLRRGQLVVESFPPLSFLFNSGSTSTIDRAWALRHIRAGASALAVVSCVARVQRGALSAAHAAAAVVGSVLFDALVREAEGSRTALGSANDVAESLLIAVLCVAGGRGPQARGPRAWASWAVYGLAVPEALGVVALLLGCNLVDFCWCGALVAARHCCVCWAHLADPEKRVHRVFIALACKLLRTAIVYAAAVAWAYSSIFPASEAAAGGNYNLQYLTPQHRRRLRPDISQYSYIVPPATAPPVSQQFAVPPHALIPGRPVSIFLPNAGFLWTDALVWDERFRGFVDDSLAAGRDHRVVFQDRINTVGPWVLQQAVDETFPRDNAYVSSYLWSGERVYLRAFESGEFLSASRNRTAPVERLFDVPSDDGFRRLHVSAAPSPSPASVWEITYTPSADRGFHLYNYAAACFLATTFRAFPDFAGQRANDTVLHELRLELEAACITTPADAAFTLFAVDGVPKDSPEARAQRWPWLSTSSGRHVGFEFGLANSKLAHALGVVRAVVSLARFRSRYPALQDTPRTLLRRSAALPTDPRDRLVRLLLLSVVCAYVLRCLQRQRQRRGRSASLRVRAQGVELERVQLERVQLERVQLERVQLERVQLERVGLEVALVALHLLLDGATTYGHRVAVVVACFVWVELGTGVLRGL